MIIAVFFILFLNMLKSDYKKLVLYDLLWRKLLYISSSKVCEIDKSNNTNVCHSRVHGVPSGSSNHYKPTSLLGNSDRDFICTRSFRSMNLIKIYIHSSNLVKLCLMVSRQKHAGKTNVLVLIRKIYFQK